LSAQQSTQDQRRIGVLYQKQPQSKKPRIYLKIAQNKNLSKKIIRKGIKPLFQYLKKNLKTVEKQLDGFCAFPLKHKLKWKYWIIRIVNLQQFEMFDSRSYLV